MSKYQYYYLKQHKSNILIREARTYVKLLNFIIFLALKLIKLTFGNMSYFTLIGLLFLKTLLLFLFLRRTVGFLLCDVKPLFSINDNKNTIDIFASFWGLFGISRHSFYGTNAKWEKRNTDKQQIPPPDTITFMQTRLRTTLLKWMGGGWGDERGLAQVSTTDSPTHSHVHVIERTWKQQPGKRKGETNRN